MSSPSPDQVSTPGTVTILGYSAQTLLAHAQLPYSLNPPANSSLNFSASNTVGTIILINTSLSTTISIS